MASVWMHVVLVTLLCGVCLASSLDMNKANGTVETNQQQLNASLQINTPRIVTEVSNKTQTSKNYEFSIDEAGETDKRKAKKLQKSWKKKNKKNAKKLRDPREAPTKKNSGCTLKKCGGNKKKLKKLKIKKTENKKSDIEKSLADNMTVQKAKLKFKALLHEIGDLTDDNMYFPDVVSAKVDEMNEREIIQNSHCYNKPADVMIVIDIFNNMSSEEFYKTLNFTIHVISLLPISTTETRIGVATLNQSLSTRFLIGEYNTEDELIAATMRLDINGHDSSNIGVSFAQDRLFTIQNGARDPYSGADYFMVLNTNEKSLTSKSTKNVLSQAEYDGAQTQLLVVGETTSKEYIREFVPEAANSNIFIAKNLDDINPSQILQIQKICNEEICSSGDIVENGVSGFNMLKLFNVAGLNDVVKTKDNSTGALSYSLHENADLRLNPSSLIFPLGLPRFYSVVAVFKMNEHSLYKNWSLYEMRDSKGEIVEALTIRGKNRTIEYITIDNNEKIVKMEFQNAYHLFEDGFHKLTLVVNQKTVALYVDCKEIGVEYLSTTLGRVQNGGEIVIAKTLSNDKTVEMDIQQLDLICDTDIASSARFSCLTHKTKEIPSSNIHFEVHSSKKHHTSSKTRITGRFNSPELTGEFHKSENKTTHHEDRKLFKILKTAGAPGENKDHREKKFDTSLEITNTSRTNGTHYSSVVITQTKEEEPGKLTDDVNHRPRPGGPGMLEDNRTYCECPPPEVIQGPKGESGEAGSIGATGSKGMTGERGKPGFNGKPGHDGQKGGVGPPGADGPRGIGGRKGPAGFEGIKGQKGASGETGERGHKGYSGKLGHKGAKGEPCQLAGALIESAKGSKGPKGSRGSTGAPGFTGEPGIPSMRMGMKGHMGPRGVQGKQGIGGPAGARGYPGSPGKIGPMGPKGEEGPQGDKGNQGLPGQAGPQGLLGNPGNTGPKGHRGQVGYPGDPGFSGLPGHKGHRGEPGERGPQGEVGKQGRPGPVGPKGPDGEFGLSGEPGLPGTPGPRGPQGTKGDKGQIGRTGDVGGRGMKGDKGDVGLQGKDGEVGPPRDMDEIIAAIKKTVADMLPKFAADIKRECQRCIPKRALPGMPGAPGPAGIGGQPGLPGKPGTDGPQGFLGKPGLIGKPGKDGPKGNKGDVGNKGVSLPGPMGPVGPEGPMGEPGWGTKGKTGSPGIRGDMGPRGSPGQPGTRGVPGLCDTRNCNPTAPQFEPDPLIDSPYSKGPPDALREEPGLYNKGPPDAFREGPGLYNKGPPEALRSGPESLANLRIDPSVIRHLKGPNAPDTYNIRRNDGRLLSRPGSRRP